MIRLLLFPRLSTDRTTSASAFLSQRSSVSNAGKDINKGPRSGADSATFENDRRKISDRRTSAAIWLRSFRDGLGEADLLGGTPTASTRKKGDVERTGSKAEIVFAIVSSTGGAGRSLAGGAASEGGGGGVRGDVKSGSGRTLMRGRNTK